jgi:hypothetical protein
MWLLEIVSPVLSEYSPQLYGDDDDSSNHVQNSIPPINIDIPFAASSVSPRGPSSSVSTIPITPGLVSPSHPGYASSPSLLTVTPTPSHMLRPDVYHSFPSSAPVFLYPSQGSQWHISNAVRILSFVLPMLVLTVSTIAIISGARACHSIQRAPTGPLGATEAIQAPHL